MPAASAWLSGMSAAPSNYPLNPSTSDICCSVVLLSLGDCGVAVLEVGERVRLALSFSYEVQADDVLPSVTYLLASTLAPVAPYGWLRGWCGG